LECVIKRLSASKIPKEYITPIMEIIRAKWAGVDSQIIAAINSKLVYLRAREEQKKENKSKRKESAEKQTKESEEVAV